MSNFSPPARPAFLAASSVKLAAGEPRRSHEFFLWIVTLYFPREGKPQQVAALPFDGLEDFESMEQGVGEDRRNETWGG